MTNKITGPVQLSRELETWNGRAKDFYELHEKPARQAQVEYFLQLVKDRRLQKVGGSALDIGCGVGDYAISLAKTGIQVTGLDLSDGMLTYGAKLAARAGVEIDWVQAPWSEEYRESQGWDKSFDFTYAILCPAMALDGAVEAMSKASQGACMLVMFDSRRDSTLDWLWSFFPPQKEEGWSVDGVLSQLRSLGYEPQINQQINPETEYFTLEEGLDYFSKRLFRSSQLTLEELKEKISPLLQTKLQKKLIENTTEDVIAWISWRVDHGK